MRIYKLFCLVYLLLSPILSFSQDLDKPYLVFKVNQESLVLDKTNIKGAHFEKGADGSLHLNVWLTPAAAEILTRITKANIGKEASLLFNGNKFISKATLQSPLGDQFQTGRFPKKEGQALIDSLKNNQSPPIK